MRDLLQPTIEALQAFVQQHDKLALILRSPAADALPMLKVIEGLEDPNPSDLFWVMNCPFQNAVDFASKIVADFSSTHQCMRLAMEKEGMTPWPEIPPRVASEEGDPVERLRALVAFSRELLPIPLGGNNVWVLYPLEIADPFAYADFIQRVLAHDFPNPWCHHLRFIIREDPDGGLLTRTIGVARSIEVHEPDLSTRAVERSLRREIDDEQLPIDVRLNSAVVLAGMEMAHGRFAESLEKYALVLRYYAPMGNHTMSAIALNGMGEVYARMGDAERANEAFQSALIPASQGAHPPLQVLQNISFNLGQLRMVQGDWSQAAGYWDVVGQLSVATRNADMKIRALDQEGYCHYRLGDAEAAEKRWHDGAAMAAAIEDPRLCATLLERRRGLYAEMGRFDRERELAQQLAELRG